MRLIPVIIIVAVLMLTVRVGDIWIAVTAEDQPAARAVSGQAFAQSDEPEAAPEEGAPGEPSDEAGQAAPPGMEPIETVDEAAPDFQGDRDLLPGEMRLMHDLAKRRERLDARARTLDEREAILEAAEQRLVSKQQQLEQLRQDIEDLVARYDTAQETEVSVLRQTYQTMKPKAAAAIFDDLDMDTLMGVVRGMPARRLAPILSAMNPEKARLVTQELALHEELPTVPQ